MTTLQEIGNVLVQEVIDALGTTDNPQYSPFILPDGTLIDGRWDPKYDNERTVDHSEFPMSDMTYEIFIDTIRTFLCDNYNKLYKVEFYQYITNTVRLGVMPRLILISFVKMPTPEQLRAIHKIISNHPYESILVDIFTISEDKCLFNLKYSSDIAYAPPHVISYILTEMLDLYYGNN